MVLLPPPNMHCVHSVNGAACYGLAKYRFFRGVGGTHHALEFIHRFKNHVKDNMLMTVLMTFFFLNSIALKRHCCCG